MVTVETLRGYVLEELLAKLLHASGYRLLVSANQDQEALIVGKHGLLVRGRGANHQADVLGELVLPTPFSLPVRLFVEAKYRRTRIGLPHVRNAHGVVHDINEQYASVTVRRDAVPMRRYQYQYALFSASGFSLDAQQYALAQQISLIDLSSPEFDSILSAAHRTAEHMLAIAREYNVRPFPVEQVRTTLRFALGSWTASTADDVVSTADLADVVDGGRDPQVIEHLARLVDQHTQAREGRGDVPSVALARVGADLAITVRRLDQSLLLGFPAAPFVLTLRPNYPGALAEYVSRQGPDIQVNIQFASRGNAAGDWVIVPADGSDGFRLRFTLPTLLADWLLNSDGAATLRARDVKAALLSSISVFQGGQVVRLLFKPHWRSGAN